MFSGFVEALNLVINSPEPRAELANCFGLRLGGDQSLGRCSMLERDLRPGRDIG